LYSWRAPAVFALLVAWSAPAGTAAEAGATAPLATAGAPAGAWETYLIFSTACAECHGGHLAKPKGKFGYILDLRRLVEEAYIHPGSPERSDVFTSLITEDPDMLMPPPDSDGPMLTAAEIETVRAWIAAGAHVAAEAPGVAATPNEEVNAGAPASIPISRVLGKLHPLVVHFPIALLSCAAVVELAFFFRPSIAWAPGMVRGCIWFGAAGAVAAAALGWMHALHEGNNGGTLETHRWLGIATAGASVTVLAIHQFIIRRTRGRGMLLLALLAAAVAAAAACHTGGLLAYGDDYFW